MKRFVLTMIVAYMAGGFVLAQKCKVLDSKGGSITFEVDKDLPMPERNISLADANAIARRVLNEFQIEEKCQNVLATSFADKRLWYKGNDAFFATLTEAFADHRPVKLSPDMLWELICLTFSEYVNNHAEEMRPLLVSHEGVKDLVIKTNLAEDPRFDLLHHPNANWNEVIRLFSKEIEAHTKGDLAQTMTADFSTTGMTERIASQVTLMDAVKQYFRFTDFAATCGIPSITLEGTPADWRKVVEKTQALEKYNMGWWTKELLPILQEFVKAAEGKPNRKFWKDIVMQDRPDRLRGGGCSMVKPTEFDGWMLKLFPNTKDKTIRKTVAHTESLGQENSHVGFKYVLYDPATNIIQEEADIELIAGFVGIEVDEATGMLSPKIGWISRKADAEAETLARIIEQQHGMPLVVDEVPTVLKRTNHLERLYLLFDKREVVIPEWMDDIDIKDFKIEGKMSEEMEAQLKQRFPKAAILSAEKQKAERAKREAEKEVRKAKLAPILTKYSQRLDSVVLCNDFDGITTFVLDYDDEGNISSVTSYRDEEKNVHDSYSWKTVTRYDAQGREVSEVSYQWNDGWVPTDTAFRDVQLYYNDSHQLDSMIKTSYYDGKVKPSTIRKYTYRYNRKGLLTEERFYRKGELELTETYKYDGKNRLVEKKSINEWTDMEYETLYAYDKHGRYALCTESSNSIMSNVTQEVCQYDLDGDRSMVYQMHYTGETSTLNEDFPKGDWYRTIAFFYDKSTKRAEVMGLEPWLKNNISALPCGSKFGISSYKPTHIVISEEGDEEPRICTFYYSYIY